MTNTSSTPAGKAPGFLDAKNAKAVDGKTTILRFGAGVDLWVLPSGIKSWRTKVQRDGKRTTVVLGYFPAMTIQQARTARLEVRNGRDVVQERRDERRATEVAEANTFAAVAERWIEARSAKAHWTPLVRKAVEQRLAKHVFPVIGDEPIGSIKAVTVEALIGKVHRASPSSAVAVKQYVSAIFDYAFRRDLVLFNPVTKIADDLPVRSAGDGRRQPAVKTIEEARAVLRAIEARPASAWILLAHRLIALTGVRKQEALLARWDEFDLANALWTIPAARMKGKYGRRREHVVALAPQAIEVIEAARSIRRNEYVFASALRRKEHIERSTLNELFRTSLALAGLGQVHTPHGWRGTFSTVMNERDRADRIVVDVMLSHVGLDKVERHYNGATYLADRRRIAAAWADLLLDGAPSARALIGQVVQRAANVVELRRAA